MCEIFGICDGAVGEDQVDVCWHQHLKKVKPVKTLYSANFEMAILEKWDFNSTIERLLNMKSPRMSQQAQ